MLTNNSNNKTSNGVKKTVIAVCVATIFFAFASFTFAQSYTPLAPLPGTFTETAGVKTTNLSMYLAGAIKLLVALGAALAVLFAIIGGTQYVAASINPSAKKDAMERIQRALLGLGIILTSYLLLNSINPKLVQFNFMLPPIGVAPGAVVETVVTPTPTPITHSTPAQNSIPNSAPVSVQTPEPIPTPTPDPTLPPAGLDPNNDYSIVMHCVGNTTYPLCSKTDLNGDHKTDTIDVSLFISRATPFDLNRNKIVELTDLPTPVSCFFKTSTANINAMLPRARVQNENGGGFGIFGIQGNSSCAGNSVTLAPTVACNGATWLKYPALESACADSATLFNSVPYYSKGPYDKFKNWIIGAQSGNLINLTTLFVETFLSRPAPPCIESCPPYDPYLESNLGKITYTTIAQYDLNNDGLVDFSAGGADIAVFNGCKDAVISGACAQADFNGDGAVDDRDVALGRTTQHPVLGSVLDLVSNRLSINGQQISQSWTLGDFESYFFGLTGYSDKQIINFWMGRKAVYGSRTGDLNGDWVVNSLDLTAFNTGAPPLDFNGDMKVDLSM